MKHEAGMQHSLWGVRACLCVLDLSHGHPRWVNPDSRPLVSPQWVPHSGPAAPGRGWGAVWGWLCDRPRGPDSLSSAALPRLASRADLEGLQSWWQAGADLGRPGYDGRSALLVVSAPGPLLPSPRPPPPGSPPDSSFGSLASTPTPKAHTPPLPSHPRPLPGPRAVGTGSHRHGGEEPGKVSWWVGGGRGGGVSGAWLLVTCSLPQAEATGNLEVVTFLQSLQGGAGAQASGPVSPLRPASMKASP